MEFVCRLPLSFPCSRGKVWLVSPSATRVSQASIFIFLRVCLRLWPCLRCRASVVPLILAFPVRLSMPLRLPMLFPLRVSLSLSSSALATTRASCLCFIRLCQQLIKQSCFDQGTYQDINKLPIGPQGAMLSQLHVCVTSLFANMF